jgi:phosphotransacetylase
MRLERCAKLHSVGMDDRPPPAVQGSDYADRTRRHGPANVLIMPALHSANISGLLLQQLGGGTVIGPVLVGFEKPAQIVQPGATVSEIVTAAAPAAFEAIR